MGRKRRRKTKREKVSNHGKHLRAQKRGVWERGKGKKVGYNGYHSDIKQFNTFKANYCRFYQLRLAKEEKKELEEEEKRELEKEKKRELEEVKKELEEEKKELEEEKKKEEEYSGWTFRIL